MMCSDWYYSQTKRKQKIIVASVIAVIFTVGIALGIVLSKVTFGFEDEPNASSVLLDESTNQSSVSPVPSTSPELNAAPEQPDSATPYIQSNDTFAPSETYDEFWLSMPTTAQQDQPEISQPGSENTVASPSESRNKSIEPIISPSATPSSDPLILNNSRGSNGGSEEIYIPSTSPSALRGTANPSHSPSEQPVSVTTKPSELPSLAPSNMPTTRASSDTSIPSYSPSEVILPESMTTKPSKLPSSVPSDIATEVRSLEPSTEPTQTPTRSPSFIPSQMPSTLAPITISPSLGLSNVPSPPPTTNSPSFYPSLNPSTSPSTQSPTTFVPSFFPSFDPTTLMPSFIPTLDPTTTPTTSMPSSTPSNTPTTSTPSALPSENPTKSPSTFPTTWSPSAIPSMIPSTMPSAIPSAIPSMMPSTRPSESPSLVPTLPPTFSPSSMPSQASKTRTRFCAISDTPFGRRERVLFQWRVQQLSNDCDFLIHLGGIKDPTDLCVAEEYDFVQQTLRLSKIPVFIVLGSNEWIDCPGGRDAEGLQLWKDRFTRFDQNWTHPFNTRYFDDGFSFISKQTIFFGLNTIGGVILDQSRFLSLLETVLGIILSNVPQRAQAIVLMFHADPVDTQARFFPPFSDFISNSFLVNYPILILHGDSREQGAYERGFSNLPNALRIQAKGSSSKPPLKLISDPTESRLDVESTFLVDRGQLGL